MPTANLNERLPNEQVKASTNRHHFPWSAHRQGKDASPSHNKQTGLHEMEPKSSIRGPSNNAVPLEEEGPQISLKDFIGEETKKPNGTEAPSAKPHDASSTVYSFCSLFIGL